MQPLALRSTTPARKDEMNNRNSRSKSEMNLPQLRMILLLKYQIKQTVSVKRKIYKKKQVDGGNQAWMKLKKALQSFD